MRWGFVLLLVSACVDNGSSGDAAATGALGGPCFSNNTCNTGLVCVIANGRALCEESDASVSDVIADQTTTTDVKSAAPPADAALDAPAEASSCGIQPARPCANMQCTPQPGCCASSGMCAPCSGNEAPWQCASRADCPGNFPCCVPLTVTNANTCPAVGQVDPTNFASCSSVNLCTVGYILCTSSSECPTTAPTCYPVSIDNFFMGYCR
jgi:hypothetical protein